MNDEKVIVGQGERGLYESLLIEYLSCRKPPQVMKAHPSTREFLRKYFEGMAIPQVNHQVCMVGINSNIGWGFEEAVIEADEGMPEWEVDYGPRLLRLNHENQR